MGLGFRGGFGYVRFGCFGVFREFWVSSCVIGNFGVFGAFWVVYFALLGILGYFRVSVELMCFLSVWVACFPSCITGLTFV